MVCMARLGIAAVMLLLISSAGVQAAPPQVLKAGDYTATANWITYKGQVRIDIGLFYVHSGWKKFFLHSAGIGKDTRRGLEGNLLFYESTAIDGSYTARLEVRTEGESAVGVDFYLTRHQAETEGGYSLIPFSLSPEFMAGARVSAVKDGKTVNSVPFSGAGEIIIDSLGYKLKLTSTAGGEWLALNKNNWVNHFYGSLKPGEERHWGAKIEFSGDMEKAAAAAVPAAEQKPPRDVADARTPGKDDFPVIPLPREMNLRPGTFRLGSGTKIITGGGTGDGDSDGAVLLQKELREIYRLPVEIRPAAAMKSFRGHILVGEPWKNRAVQEALAEQALTVTPESPGKEGYLLLITPEEVVVAGSDDSGTFWGIQTLLQLLRQGGKEVCLPALIIRDRPALPVRGACFFSEAPVPVSSFETFAEKVMARHKLNTLVLSLDNWFNFPSHPEINPKGVQRGELEKVLEICQRNRIRVVPEIDCLRSVSGILKAHPELAENPRESYPDACPSNPALYKLLEDLFSDVEEIARPYGGFDIFSIACDEVQQADFGMCQRCKATGKTPPELFARAITCWHDYWAAKGIRTMVIGDSLRLYGRGQLEPARKLIPKDTIISFWGYAGGGTPSPFKEEGFPVIGCWQFHSGNISDFAVSVQDCEKGLGIYGLHTTLSRDLLQQALDYPNAAHNDYLNIYAGDCAWNPGKRSPADLPYNMYQRYLDLLSCKPNLSRDEKPRKGFLVDLQPYLNYDLPARLKDLPRGEVRLGDTLFATGDKGVVVWGPLLGSIPEKVSIPIGRKAESLVFLHGCLKDIWADYKGYAGWKGEVGRYRIFLEGDAVVDVNLVTCEQIQAFSATPERGVTEPASIAWQGQSGRLYSCRWKNPDPTRMIEKMEFISGKTKAGPMLLAVTGLEE